jgi:glutamate dehydrogenase
VREIAATQLASNLIDRVGPGFLYRLEERTGAATPAAARAFRIVQDVFDLPWSAADGLPPLAEQAVLREIQALAEHAAEALLGRGEIGGAGGRYRAPVRELAEASAEHPGTLARRDSLIASGVPDDLAARVAVLAGLTHALDLADAAADLGEPVPLVAGRHDAVAERFDLSWLMAQSAPEPTDTYWAHAAKAALRDELTEQWCSSRALASPASSRPPQVSG